MADGVLAIFDIVVVALIGELGIAVDGDDIVDQSFVVAAELHIGETAIAIGKREIGLQPSGDSPVRLSIP